MGIPPRHQAPSHAIRPLRVAMVSGWEILDVVHLSRVLCRVVSSAGAEELWRARVPSRLKFFFWLPLHKRLCRCKRHGLQDSNACALCDQITSTRQFVWERDGPVSCEEIEDHTASPSSTPALCFVVGASISWHLFPLASSPSPQVLVCWIGSYPKP